MSALSNGSSGRRTAGGTVGLDREIDSVENEGFNSEATLGRCKRLQAERLFAATMVPEAS